MYGDFVGLVNTSLNQSMTPESEATILDEVLRDVNKNGGIIQFDNISMTLGVPACQVKEVVRRNNGTIQNAIKNNEYYTQSDFGAFNKEVHNSHSTPTDTSNGDGSAN